MARITLRPGTDLKAMAKACNMSWEEFSRDNPHMLKTVSHTELPCDVYVPARLSYAALAYSSNPVTVSRAQFAQSSRSERAGKAGKRTETWKWPQRMDPGSTVPAVLWAERTEPGMLTGCRRTTICGRSPES